jgi:DNA-binding GntR family transcriptional regulator
MKVGKKCPASAHASSPRRGGKADPEMDNRVYAAISRAIMAGELKAGTKLSEPRLAEIFSVSRERIRKVLYRLGAERRLQIIPNRGAHVPRPTREDMQTVYEAHRVLEAGILCELVRSRPANLISRLDGHLAEERAAAMRGDRAASVRLSGTFHLHLVDALGNVELSRFLHELLSRSSVMVSVYEEASQSICAVDEHGAIVEALRDWDADRAVRLSREHFLQVERRLRPRDQLASRDTLESVFSQYATRPRRKK